MQLLSPLLALNGSFFLLFSSLIGLVLARSLRQGTKSEHWHLLHSGGTSRGIMLLALSASVQFADLPASQLFWSSGLVVLFVWTSVIAMLVRALTGEMGFHPGGSSSNKLVFYLYAAGTIALPVGLVWLMVGFFMAMN